jgi:hypothetical protein
VALPESIEVDGRSLMPLLERADEEWQDRSVVVQAHRGNEGVRYHHFLLRTDRWKLLNASGFGKEVDAVEQNFELYDMKSDPLELTDLASNKPEVVAELRAKYDAWFDDVSTTRPDNWSPPSIVIGSPQAPVVTLTRQDWRKVTGGGWSPNSQGNWAIDVVDSGEYQMRIRFLKNRKIKSADVRCGNYVKSTSVSPDAQEVSIKDLNLPKGKHLLQIDLESAKGVIGPYQVEIRKHQK